MYGYGGGWAFCIYFIYRCLCVCDEVSDVCVWSSIEIDDGVDWICFTCCCMYLDDDRFCFWDIYVVYSRCMYSVLYVDGDIFFVYGGVVVKFVAILVGLVGEVVIW